MLDIYATNPKIPGDIHHDEMNDSSLFQGDLINIDVDKDLNERISYHVDKELLPRTAYYIVVNQSCDLQVRNDSKFPKLDYIAMSPVFPANESIDLIIKKNAKTKVDDRIVMESGRAFIDDYIRKLLNYNVPEYFLYVDNGITNISDYRSNTDYLLAHIRYSVSLKTKDFYASILKSKKRQLKSYYQNKLGANISDFYSRIAVPEADPASLNEFIQTLVNDKYVYIPNDVVAFIASHKTHASKINEIQDISDLKEYIQNLPYTPAIDVLCHTVSGVCRSKNLNKTIIDDVVRAIRESNAIKRFINEHAGLQEEESNIADFTNIPPPQ
jgi:hypothetical protein